MLTAHLFTLQLPTKYGFLYNIISNPFLPLSSHKPKINLNILFQLGNTTASELC